MSRREGPKPCGMAAGLCQVPPSCSLPPRRLGRPGGGGSARVKTSKRRAQAWVRPALPPPATISTGERRAPGLRKDREPRRGSIHKVREQRARGRVGGCLPFLLSGSQFL